MAVRLCCCLLTGWLITAKGVGLVTQLTQGRHHHCLDLLSTVVMLCGTLMPRGLDTCQAVMQAQLDSMDRMLSLI